MQVKEITGGQLRAARGALNLSVRKLAEKTGVGTATIVRYEEAQGVPAARKGNLELLISTLEAAGIEFTGTPDDAPGIRIHRVQDRTTK